MTAEAQRERDQSMMDGGHSAPLRQTLADEAQRIAIDAEYLGRQHLIASEGWRRRAVLFAIPATVVVAAVAAAAAGVAALIGADSRVTVVLAFLAAIASVARLLLKPADEAGGHSIKGIEYLAVRSDARRLRNIGLSTDPDLTAVRKELDQLVDRLNALRAMEPRALSPELLDKVRARVRRGDYAYEKDPLWEAGPAAAATGTTDAPLQPPADGYHAEVAQASARYAEEDFQGRNPQWSPGAGRQTTKAGE